MAKSGGKGGSTRGGSNSVNGPIQIQNPGGSRGPDGGTISRAGQGGSRTGGGGKQGR